MRTSDDDVVEAVAAQIADLRHLADRALTEHEETLTIARDFARALRKIADGGAGAHRIADDVLRRHPSMDRAW